LPRHLDLPAWLTMRLRVAPYPASFGRAGDESTSCPVHSVHSAVPAMDHRVASTFASSTLPVLKLRVAPILRCLVSPIDEVPGYPVSFIFRLCRRWIFESPRISHPSAVPTGRFPRLPRFRDPSVSPMMSLRVAPNSHLPAPAGGYPSFLGSHPPVCQWRFLRLPQSFVSGSSDGLNLRVAPNLRFLGGRRLINPPSCPRVSILRLIRICFPGLPRFRIYGWVDDEFPFVSNFASSAEPRMNLRVQSSLAVLA